MKKILWILSILIVLSLISIFAYFYYIKPQREYIKTLVQNCIATAMNPIDSETAKQSPNPYITQAGFDSMLQTQLVEINKCTSTYDTILFSSAEVNLFKLDITSKLDAQKAEINAYTKRINDRLADIKQQQDQQKACSDMKAEYKNYQDCVSTERKKGNAYYSSADYITSSFSLLSAPSNTNDSKDICLQKYNYKKFGVNDFSCIMSGITY